MKQTLLNLSAKKVLIIAAVGFVVLIVLAKACGSDTSSVATTAKKDNSSPCEPVRAYAITKQLVKQVIRNESSATFEPFKDRYVTKTAGGFHVEAHYFTRSERHGDTGQHVRVAAPGYRALPHSIASMRRSVR